MLVLIGSWAVLNLTFWISFLSSADGTLLWRLGSGCILGVLGHQLAGLHITGMAWMKEHAKPDVIAAFNRYNTNSIVWTLPIAVIIVFSSLEAKSDSLVLMPTLFMLCQWAVTWLLSDSLTTANATLGSDRYDRPQPTQSLARDSQSAARRWGLHALASLLALVALLSTSSMYYNRSFSISDLFAVASLIIHNFSRSMSKAGFGEAGVRARCPVIMVCYNIGCVCRVTRTYLKHTFLRVALCSYMHLARCPASGNSGATPD